MTDDELIAEAHAHNRAADVEALRTPVTLARHLDRRYKLRPHIRLIGEALGTVRPGSGDRILITTPPQVGKTVTAAVWFPYWWLAHWPDQRVIIGSYNNNLAVNRGKQVRKLVNEHGQLYGLAMERGSQKMTDWALVSGGGVFSVGVGGGVTGNSGDLIVIDDPVKSRAEADSQRIRDKIYDWMSGDVNSRRQPGSPMIIIMTRWHEDDLGGRMIKEQGRVEEGGRWRVIHLPAIAGSNDALGRLPGDPLPHPKIHPRNRVALLDHWHDRRDTSTVRDWHALYLGDPTPDEGALIDAATLRKRTLLIAPTGVRPLVHAVAVDPSGGGRDEAGIVGGFRGTDGRVYWSHDLSGVMATADWARATCELAMLLDAEMIIFESTFGGDQAGLIIRTAWKALAAERKMPDLPPRIIAVPARKNKKLRAEPVAQLLVEDRVRLLGYHPELCGQWTSWRPTDTTSPGRIDASVYLALGLVVSEPAEIGSPSQPNENAPAPTLPTVPGTPALPRPGLPTVPGMPGGIGRLPTIPGFPNRR